MYRALFETMAAYPGLVHGAFFWDTWMPSTRDTGKRPGSIAPTPSAGSCPNRPSASGTTGSGRPRGLRGGPVGIRKNDPGRGQFANTEHHSRRCRRRSRTPGRLRRRPSNGTNAPDAGGHAARVERPRPTMVRGPPRVGRGAGGATEREHQMSDGTTREGVDAEWMSSNTVVATITGSGSLAGRQPGGFEVRAESEGLSARLSGLRVVPSHGPDFTIQNVRRYPVVIAPRTGSSSTCTRK